MLGPNALGLAGVKVPVTEYVPAARETETTAVGTPPTSCNGMGPAAAAGNGGVPENAIDPVTVAGVTVAINCSGTFAVPGLGEELTVVVVDGVCTTTVTLFETLDW